MVVSLAIFIFFAYLCRFAIHDLLKIIVMFVWKQICQKLPYVMLHKVFTDVINNFFLQSTNAPETHPVVKRFFRSLCKRSSGNMANSKPKYRRECYYSCGYYVCYWMFPLSNWRNWCNKTSWKWRTSMLCVYFFHWYVSILRGLEIIFYLIRETITAK